MKRLISFAAAVAVSAAAITAINVRALADDDIITDAQARAIAAKATPTPEPEEKVIETGDVYQAYEKIAGYVAERYIDDSYTAEDIMKLGLSSYLEEYDDEALVPLMKAALQSLDDYSDFYTRSEYIEYNNQLNKTFYGLGVMLRQDGEYVAIDGFVEENSLAEISGFKADDKFVKVDGINVVGSSITEVRNLVVGELGTTVLVTVLRDGQEVEITGIRTAVNNATVSGGIFEGNIGYIKIVSFSSGTADEFTETMKSLRDSGVKKLILDLRNNPGGYLSAATAIAQEIVPAGKVVDVAYRDSTMNYTYYSELKDAPFDILVLVNGNTASSAEILASAIQDSGVGILMGEQTFGKAVIQSVFSLRNGMVFKLTIGQYLTRNGNEIDHVGLTPDKEVSNYSKKIDTSGYTKFDFLNRVSVGGSGTNVTAAKERLTIMGYFIGNLGNDVFNTDLRDAIKAFQTDNGLVDNGTLDIATQIKIKKVFESLETTVDFQMQEAYRYFGGNVDDLYSE